MKISLGSPASYIFAVGFVVAPAMIALAILLLTHGAGQVMSAKPYLLAFTVLSIVPGVLFLERMRRLQRGRLAQPPGPETAYEALRLGALGIGCFVAAEFFIVAFIDWRVAAGYLGLVIIWVLLWTPSRNRLIVVRTAVQVNCTPQAAFELVSNPTNWSRYAPEIELAQPVEVPVRLGTVIHDRVRRDGKITVVADEEVVALESGARFGTAIQRDPQSSSGVYEFVPTAGGTSIEYTHRSVMSLPAAIFGMALRRASLMKQMSERRAQSLARIKRLLEEPGPISV
jgi:hypothetical protein